MSRLTANDLKTGGVTAIVEVLARQPEAVIAVRGKDRYVVMDLARYHHLLECELDAALARSQADLAAGRYFVESASSHMERLDALLAPGDRRHPVRAGAASPGRRKPAARSSRG